VSQKPTISLIVPTRHRTAPLRRLLQSLAATTANLAALEIVLVLDADDRESLAFQFEQLPLKRVVVEPGLAMGALNMAGYEASAGDYLMLLNDDVIARTQKWDRQVLACFRAFPDGVVLVHTNDTLFRDGMCTFPLVSRTFCELTGGICPRAYLRYRIDDHIEDIFNLLGVLGERRTFYLPEVVFEHAKFVTRPDGGRAYFLDEQVLALDAPRFAAEFSQRKELALRLKEHIVGPTSEACRAQWRSRLDQVTDYESLRVPGRQRVMSNAGRVRRCLAAGLHWVHGRLRQAR
jgi:glycosyltransferase involved in cell wall biosynthesis